MILKKESSTMIEEFKKQFKGKSYRLEIDTKGDIIFCETDDKKIISWLQEKGII